MDLLGKYGSGDEGSDGEGKQNKPLPVVEYKSLAIKNAAPLVPLDLKSHQRFDMPMAATKEIKHNPTAVSMWTPIAGPHNPFKKSSLGQEQGIVNNVITGFYEKTNYDNMAFEEQYHTYMRYGYSQDPSSLESKLIGDKDAIEKYNGQTIFSVVPAPVSDEQKQLRKKRKELTGNVEDIDNYQGPWGTYYYADQEEMPEANDEQKEHAAKLVLKKQKKKREEKEDNMEESSEFHGDKLYDYQGRSYIHPPPNLKPTPDAKNYIPKKLIHTWSGHTKGVSAIRFFPKYGHLMLSASMDSTIKIWDVYNQRKCLRTFYGHTEAVRDIDFNYDGTKFVSVSYDRYIKVWDTETGQLVSKHTSGKVPFCAKIHPEPDLSHEILVGQADKLVVQWDTRADEIVQKYDEHLGPVNTITFIDNNKKFLSTSDDKKAFVWEYGIPVVHKHIAEPDMHSMPYVAVHPSGKHWVGQSQDNRLMVFGAVAKVKLMTRKQFVGHLSAGYACQLGFSPDGKIIYSGDAQGRVFFWDYRTSKIYKKLKCHDQVCIGAIWHPIETSRFATCSWDGTIKYWD